MNTEIPSNYGKPYTSEEVDTILTLLPTKPFKVIANKIGRKPENIENKIERMGLGVKEAIGMMSANQLSKILGVDHKVIVNWINNKGMPVHKKSLTLGSQNKSYKDRKYNVYLIDNNTFWKWAKDNQHLLDLRRVDTSEYIPDWAMELRFKQLVDIPQREGKRWTDREISYLKWEMSKDKVDLDSLSAHFRRSVQAVESKWSEIKQKRQTPEEIIRERFGVYDVASFLNNLYHNKNMSVVEISGKLGIPNSTIYQLIKRHGIKMSAAKKRNTKRSIGFVVIGNERLLVTGRKMNKGYVFLKIKDHPFASKQGLVSEQRVVMEQKLGRYLKPWERVRRKNGNKEDNNPENLYIHETKNKK